VFLVKDGEAVTYIIIIGDSQASMVEGPQDEAGFLIPTRRLPRLDAALGLFNAPKMLHDTGVYAFSMKDFMPRASTSHPMLRQVVREFLLWLHHIVEKCLFSKPLSKNQQILNDG
jgi:hypothetical protein